jgi:hypothetical protein
MDSTLTTTVAWRLNQTAPPSYCTGAMTASQYGGSVNLQGSPSQSVSVDLVVVYIRGPALIPIAR